MTEAWLRGPVDGIAPLFQPAAHAFVQAREDVARVAADLPADVLWRDPGADAATPGFHLVHLVNSLDRLLTYARGEMLSPDQIAVMRGEAAPRPDLDGAALVARVEAGLASALDQVRRTDPATAFDARRVGRSGLPSTVLGLIFHAAEHTTRHVGQFITTAKIARARP